MLADEVKDATKGLKKSKSLGKFFIRLLIGLFVIVVLFGLWVIWFLAGTGLVAIPLLSRFSYDKPEPVRVIETEETVEISVSDQLLDIKADQDVVEFIIHEKALTGSFRRSISDYEQEAIDASQSQIAVIDGEGLEIFLPLAQNKHKTALRLYLTIRDDEGSFEPEVTEFFIGSRKVPTWATRMLASPFLEQGFAPVEEELRIYLDSPTIEFADQAVILKGNWLLK